MNPSVWKYTPDNDQFLRLDAGKGKVVMGDAEDNLTFEQEVGDGWALMVSVRKWHDIIGLSNIFCVFIMVFLLVVACNLGFG